MNAIISKLQAKVDELGADAAALYYSGDGPGKKITAAQLAKVIAAEDMPTPRMCLRVVEDLDKAFLEEVYANNRTIESAQQYRTENEQLRSDLIAVNFDNGALLARIRLLENQQNTSMMVASQGFNVSQPFAPAPGDGEHPCTVQPWATGNANGMPVYAEPSVEEVGPVS